MKVDKGSKRPPGMDRCLNLSIFQAWPLRASAQLSSLQTVFCNFVLKIMTFEDYYPTWESIVNPYMPTVQIPMLFKMRSHIYSLAQVPIPPTQWLKLTSPFCEPLFKTWSMPRGLIFNWQEQYHCCLFNHYYFPHFSKIHSRNLIHF